MHLWAGILLSLYVVLIALSGSILVFEDEFTATTFPSRLHPYTADQTASVPAVMRALQQACASCVFTNLQTPSATVPAYLARAMSAGKHELHFVIDPITAEVFPQQPTWVEWVQDLHVYLLLGEAHGEQVNGVGAIILLVLAISGVVIWWPGIKHWRRAIAVSFHHQWRRINYDAHSAVGFWTLLIVTWWSISGIYFGWYKQVVSAVSLVSPMRGMISPDLPPLPANSGPSASLDAILAAAQKASPQGRLFSIGDPSLQARVIYLLIDRRAPGDFSHRDIVSVDTKTARVLTVWHYGQNQTPGDWFIWSMHPLHFGTVWGTAVKVVWFVLGVSLAILSITGLIMYWNRYLRHRIRTLA